MKIYIAPPPIIGNESKWHCQRGEKIVRDGLAQIPEVEIVDNDEKADVVLWDYRPHFKGEKSRELINKIDPSILAIVDWTDEPLEIHREDCLVYFKRSWVLPQYTRGLNPVKYSIERPANWYPFVYCMMPEFEVENEPERDIDIGCVLRPTCPNRQWVMEAVRHFARTFPEFRVHIGQINSASRSVGEACYFDQDYLKMLKRCKILVTCEPSFWSGDSRLGEGFAARSLVFSDKIYVPYPNKPVHKEHLVEFEVGRYDQIEGELLDYLRNPQEARFVAENGYQLAKKYHTPLARMSYVIDTIKWAQRS
jgi:hypothetical protein